jgi:hypothetical protein
MKILIVSLILFISCSNPMDDGKVSFQVHAPNQHRSTFHTSSTKVFLMDDSATLLATILPDSFETIRAIEGSFIIASWWHILTTGYDSTEYSEITRITSGMIWHPESVGTRL